MRMNTDNIYGVILSGGKSSRMGKDKGLLEYKGKLMAQHSIDLLSVYFKNIVISANNDKYSQFGIPVISDLIPDKGPLGGLYSVMSSIPSDYYFVISCDTPNIPSQAVELILESIEDGFDCFVPQHSNGIEPMFAVYSKSSFNSIREHIFQNRLKVQGFLGSINTQYVGMNEMIDLYPGMFLNINSPSDL